MINLEVDDNDEVSKEILLNKLMDEYGNDLKRIAYLYVKDHAQCEDILQEVFISCYKQLDNFRGESSYKTWLIRITINKCKDYQRKWSFRNIVYKPLIEPFVNGKSGSAESLVVQKENNSYLIDCITSLPPKYKEILILFYYQNMTMKEISEITKLNINTVKSRLAREKKLLKEKMEGGRNHG